MKAILRGTSKIEALKTQKAFSKWKYGDVKEVNSVRESSFAITQREVVEEKISDM